MQPDPRDTEALRLRRLTPGSARVQCWIRHVLNPALGFFRAVVDLEPRPQRMPDTWPALLARMDREALDDFASVFDDLGGRLTFLLTESGPLRTVWSGEARELRDRIRALRAYLCNACDLPPI